MTTLREASQQALEALEALQGGCTDHNDGTVEAITVWCPEVIEALEAALAQQEQTEPVAHLWQHSETGRTRVVMPDQVVTADANWLVVGPLYLHPPRREPLTVADLQQALVDVYLVDHDAIDDPDGYDAGSTVARIDALHAWLKEKNHE